MFKRVAPLALLMAGAFQVSAGPWVFVPGTAKIWLAGMPDGTDAGGGDFAPNQNPSLVSGLYLNGGGLLSFYAYGNVAHGPNKTLSGPDGSTLSSHNFGAQFGMSDLGAPLNSLAGVFLGDVEPYLVLPPPPALTWGAQNLGNYLNLSPLLQQTFFIGDGWTDHGKKQTITIPNGATRLYLGTLDGFEWNNNIGEFSVNVESMPEPSTAVLLGSALIAVGLFGRLRRRA
ncbi:MAG: PEP-CTERM sorting domain-containing protein [Bryobacteraceae bacterium]